MGQFPGANLSSSAVAAVLALTNGSATQTRLLVENRDEAYDQLHGRSPEYSM